MKHLPFLFLVGCSLISCRDHRQTQAEEGMAASLEKISQLEGRLEVARDEIKDMRDAMNDVRRLKEEQSKLNEKLEKVGGAQDDSHLIIQQLTTQQKDFQGSIDRLSSRQTETNDQILNLARRIMKISDAVEGSGKQASYDPGGNLSNEQEAQVMAIKERVSRLTKREKELELALTPSHMPNAFTGSGRAAWIKKDQEMREPLMKELQDIRELLLQENRRLNELITGSR